MSMPGFWLSLVLIIVFAVKLGWFTSGTGTGTLCAAAAALGFSWAAGLMYGSVPAC